MIVLHLYNPETETWQNGDIKLLSLPLHGDQRLWLNLSNASTDEQQQLLAKFNIHPEIAEDFLRERHPPKLESSNGFTLMILRAYAGKDFKDYPGHAQLSLLFSNQVLLYKCQLPEQEYAYALPTFDLQQPAMPIKDWVKHYIHAVSASYLEKLINFEDELSEFEDAMLNHGDDQKMAQIMRYRSVFRKLDRNLAYQKEMFADLLDLESEHLLKSLFQPVELRDFYEKFERLLSMTQMYYDQLGDLVSGYMSTSSHQINERMKLLTMVSTVFIPLTFIVGMYGMNFDNMPELHLETGYYWTIAVMTVLALAMLLGFKIKRWW
ncbi:magnesium transporter [Rheinheimera sp. SA_1]|uniref:magnesium transporter CorA family protein n=1 Tax=Rheinheimera sp. SA_1 TaxID=1827365 RepID=UPI0007FC0BA0|nr:magnesium transporter CorA family protein [Rheinheimera sp. SA_1]OBP14677.1 magnesium transporter [Rheinheimera sp. SA_1]